MTSDTAPVIKPNHSSAPYLTDPEFLADLRSQMLKFAMLRLRDEAMAEDAVQDALIGALKNAGSFDQRSALKTWVFAILKNKISDMLRKGQRVTEVNRQIMDTVEELPPAWSQPMESIKSAQFWNVFNGCLSGLPKNQARLFKMRELQDLNSAEIRETMNITTSNLHVMLYRARLRLRKCLEHRWFDDGNGKH